MTCPWVSAPTFPVTSNLADQQNAAMATPIGLMALKLIIASQAASVQSIMSGDGGKV